MAQKLTEHSALLRTVHRNCNFLCLRCRMFEPCCPAQWEAPPVSEECRGENSEAGRTKVPRGRTGVLSPTQSSRTEDFFQTSSSAASSHNKAGLVKMLPNPPPPDSHQHPVRQALFYRENQDTEVQRHSSSVWPALRVSDVDPPQNGQQNPTVSHCITCMVPRSLG